MSKPTYQFDWFRYDLNAKHNKLRCNFLYVKERERAREAEKKNGCLTLQSCCPGDSSSNGWREKHFEHANNITCALILFAEGSFDRCLLKCLVCFSSKAHTCAKFLSGHSSLCSLERIKLSAYFHQSVLNWFFVLYFHEISSSSQ